MEGYKMNDEKYTIRNETPGDFAETENLVREAFWNVYRPGCLEHYVLHIMRNSENFVKDLDFVMEKDKKLIGQVVYTRAQIQADDGRTIPILTMGPIGILPAYKRKGYGKALLDYSLKKATALGAGAVCFEGNIAFYGKSGFVIASTMGIHYHGEPRENEVPYFLCKELIPGYLSKVEGFFEQPLIGFIDNAAAEEFDKHFPYKEKERLPGQLA